MSRPEITFMHKQDYLDGAKEDRGMRRYCDRDFVTDGPVCSEVIESLEKRVKQLEDALSLGCMRRFLWRLARLRPACSACLVATGEAGCRAFCEKHQT